ncbi:MAG: sigma-70 family RNA polymerase sigma factor [Pirellulales bacterium]|nr:sigma-70 family RNA polymerase sigma factor [Pirellulales bacterium]
MSDDDRLVERIRGGDAEALAEYIDACRPRLFAFIERNLSDAMRRKIEADDLVQETAVDCVRSLADVDLTDRDPFGWLCQVAERRIIDAHRKHFGTQKRDAAREVPLGTPGGETGQAAVIDLLIASITSPSKAFSRDQKQIRMLAAIDTLPQQQQEALRMRYVEGLPTKDIAMRLKKSDVSVRVMLTRTIQKLQQMLAQPGDEH